MAGANGIFKFARVNREDQLNPLRAFGVEYFQRDIFTVTTNTITASQILMDLVLTALTPNAINGPTAQDVFTLMSQNAPGQIGDRFQITIENTDPINPKVITMGAGFTPATITIPPSTIMYASWEVTATNPPAFRLFSLFPTGSGSGGLVTSWTGMQGTTRTGAVIAINGDYNATAITNVPAGNISALNVQLALNELDQEKVTLRTHAGAVGGGATAATDILVANAAGDNYIPSTDLDQLGRIAALVAGAAAGGSNVQTPHQYTLESRGQGPGLIPASGLTGSFLTGEPPVLNAWAMFVSNAFGSNNFGQTALQYQVGYVSGFSAAVGAGVVGLGGPVPVGAYHFMGITQGNAAPVFFVNAYGHVGITDPVSAGATGPVNLDAFSRLTTGAIPSSRKVKKDIQDLPRSTDWIQDLRPRQFQYKEGPQDYPRYGLILEEMDEVGVPKEAYVYNRKQDDRSQLERSEPGGVCWEAITTALIDQVQKLTARLDELEGKKEEKPKQHKPKKSSSKSSDQ